ncbi:phage portal protein [Wukongibacter sp. M2B1]|uniref:phage portal protein n=1 Tax=Wukongibacter sp. M2B1 TaxID=3088895 RepID=UPI003D795B68
MGIFNKIWKKDVKNATTFTLDDVNALSFLGITEDSSWDITYFTCLKTLCEIMGKLDIKKYKIDSIKGKERVYDEELNYLLNIEPNPYYTASTLKQSIELQRNHYGNSYAYIERERGKIKHLWVLPSSEVSTWYDNAGILGKKNAIWYVWQDGRSGKQYTFNMKEIIHLKSSITWDGIVGKAIKDIIATNIDTAKYGQDYLNKLYKGNMQSSKILLQYTGNLDTKGQKELIQQMENFSTNVGTGTFLPLPLGLSAVPLGNKLVDTEFSVLRQANALQIASAFGIPPNFLNDLTKSSYANSITQQQSLMINTMQPIFTAYGQEYTRKLIPFREKGKTILEVDTKALFKLNPIEQMEVLQKGSQSFAFTVNEMREELGLPYLNDEKANIPIGNGNAISLDLVGSQYTSSKGGE